MGSWEGELGELGDPAGTVERRGFVGDNRQPSGRPPWLRGSSDCRVGQAPMQAVHGFPGGVSIPHSPTTSFASSTTAHKWSGKRHHDVLLLF